ncbi:TPA: hypothetical protein ACQVJW_005826, partial [Serratia marcescens]
MVEIYRCGCRDLLCRLPGEPGYRLVKRGKITDSAGITAAILPPLRAKNKKATSRKVAFLYDFKAKIWWPLLGLNQRPSDYES